MNTPWEQRYAQRTKRMKSSAIRELLKLTEQPDIISFGGGLPAPEVFPVEEFQQACKKVLQDQGSAALQYGPTEGYAPLRQLIAQRATQMKLKVSADNVLITTGSQQALDLLGKVFIDEGDRVLVEAPTYLGALQAWNLYGAAYTTVLSDADGMITDRLEQALQSNPKFIYVLPNFQNPTGVTLSLERRERLVESANRHGIPIVEDDPYGQLRYEGEHLPSIEVLDCHNRGESECYSGNVIYLGTFSKILAPGIRLGWVIAPTEVVNKLVQAKQGADLHTATFDQMVAYEVSHTDFLDRHIQFIRQVYHERRNVMLDCLEEHMPPGVTWTRPQGGLFLWVKLPDGLDATVMLRAAVEEKVAFVPGDSFFPAGGGQNTLRLNFSNATPEKINEGIARLGKVFRQGLH